MWLPYEEIVALLVQYLADTHSSSRKVTNFLSPSQLQHLLDLSLQDTWSSRYLLAHLEEVLQHSVATQHPLFFNQLYAGADPIGIIGDRVAAVLNTSMATYEIAPVFTLMETEVFACIAEHIGRENYDGLMCSWWSMTNQYAIQFARYRLFPEWNKLWMYNTKPFHIYTSDQAHYSITKAAQLLWIGSDNVIVIPTDDSGMMIIEILEEAILDSQRRWALPLMINATAGTTVLWSYDPLIQIAELAEKYSIRLHVDMIRWGSVFLSEQYNYKIAGIERADSFWRNPHKMLGAPLQCSVFMTQHIEIVGTCNVLKAKYLFQQDKGYDVWCDTGDKYVQCGRKVDVLKIWLMWKVYGTIGLAQRVNTAFANAQYFADRVRKSDRLFLIQEPSCTNVCFRYLPTSIEKSVFDYTAMDDATYEVLHSLTARMKQRMLEDGEMMISYQTNKWLPNFFRMIIVNPKVTHTHLDYVVSYLQDIGKELE